MYIVFDIGGTKTRIAGSEDGIRFSQPIIYNTPHHFKEGVSHFWASIKAISKGKAVRAVAGGIAGTLDHEKKVLLASPYLQDWIGKPLHLEFEKVAEAPVHIYNDAQIAGFGEAHLGSGKGFPIVVYFTVSTGIGGARIVNGNFDVTHFGSEPGHQILDGKHSLEDLVSGTAVHKKYGKHPADIHEKEVWESLAAELALGIHNSVLHWSPDIVVLGGSMIIKEVGISVEAVERYLRKIMKMFPTIPVIKKAALGDLAGLHGALYSLKHKA